MGQSVEEKPKPQPDLSFTVCHQTKTIIIIEQAHPRQSHQPQPRRLSLSPGVTLGQPRPGAQILSGLQAPALGCSSAVSPHVQTSLFGWGPWSGGAARAGSALEEPPNMMALTQAQAQGAGGLLSQRWVPGVRVSTSRPGLLPPHPRNTLWEKPASVRSKSN